MKISIITLFPDMFKGPFDLSIIKNAKEKELVDIEFVNIRDFGIGKHQIVDDTLYGGGTGMILRVDVVHAALKQVIDNSPYAKEQRRIIFVSAQGQPFQQKKAQELSTNQHLIFLCGHYEGIDERIKHFIDEEISIGDFVVTGGEIPTMLMVDAIIRLIPNVLKEGATEHESFSFAPNDAPLLEYPQYTRPPEYEGHVVPEILLSGNHQKIAEWRHQTAEKKTNSLRPDLLKKTN